MNRRPGLNAHKFAIFRATRGFTLVEVLVAMALTAMVITLLSAAMRTGLMSWRKLGLESQAEVFSYAVPSSLGRYLESTATEATPWKGRTSQVFPLCGSRDGIVFYSTYGPPGSTRQGLRLIAYLHDPSQNVLSVYDAEIIEKEGEERDLLALAQRVLEGKELLGPPLSAYGDVIDFQLAFGDSDPSDSSGRKILWQDHWPCEETPRPPRKVQLLFAVRSGPAAKVTTWIFPTRIP